MNSRMRKNTGRGQGVFYAEASVPVGLGCGHPLGGYVIYGYVQLLNSSLNPYISGTFMEASSYRHDQLLIPFPALFSSLEDGGLRLKIPNV